MRCLYCRPHEDYGERVGVHNFYFSPSRRPQISAKPASPKVASKYHYGGLGGVLMKDDNAWAQLRLHEHLQKTCKKKVNRAPGGSCYGANPGHELPSPSQRPSVDIAASPPFILGTKQVQPNSQKSHFLSHRQVKRRCT